MRVTQNVFSGKEVVVIIVCVDREENECHVIALDVLQVNVSVCQKAVSSYSIYIFGG